MIGEQTDDSQKVVIEYPQWLGTSSTFEALTRSTQMKRILELMSSMVEAHAIITTPPPKKQRIEKYAPQVNPPPQVSMLDIKDSDIEQETHPISFSCPIIVIVMLPTIVSKTQAFAEPLEFLVDKISFSKIHLSKIITLTIMSSYVPLTIPITIPSSTLSKITIPYSTINQKLGAPIQLAFLQPSQAQVSTISLEPIVLDF